MLNFSTSSSVLRREVDAFTCLLYQAKLGTVGQVVGSRPAPPEYFEPVSGEISELGCGEKDELARCAGLRSTGAHQ
jgi:hypothetical protein